MKSRILLEKKTMAQGADSAFSLTLSVLRQCRTSSGSPIGTHEGISQLHEFWKTVQKFKATHIDKLQ